MSTIKVSIVTPSYNSGRFLCKTIESVLGQNYENLEYIIKDGGSTDETSKILAAYQPRLAHCVSQPDSGQYDAINKGFALATGDVMAWLNADDIYLQGTLRLVARIFEQFPEIKWLTTRYPLVIDENDQLITASAIPGFNAHGFLCGDNLPSMGWLATEFIQQESTFWRQSLWKEAGGYVDSELHFAADFELWARFFCHADLYAIDVPLACFRKHAAQKTSMDFQQYRKEAKSVLKKIGGHVPNPYWQWLRLRIAATRWLGSGRFGWQKILFKPSKRVVFNWSDDAWNIVEY